jgi:hypothetical protein
LTKCDGFAHIAAATEKFRGRRQYHVIRLTMHSGYSWSNFCHSRYVELLAKGHPPAFA